jgi:hypothetical protein
MFGIIQAINDTNCVIIKVNPNLGEKQEPEEIYIE